jgi:hypothetical protein
MEPPLWRLLLFSQSPIEVFAMSELVRFTVKEGTEVTVEKKGGPIFRYTMKRDMVFLSFVRGPDVYSSEVGFRVNDHYTIWLRTCHVQVENAEWCPRCDGRGTLTISTWKPPQRCFRCAGRGLFTARDQAFYDAWHQRKYGRPPAQDTEDVPLLF